LLKPRIGRGLPADDVARIRVNVAGRAVLRPG
jgi:hypothetical protein